MLHLKQKTNDYKNNLEISQHLFLKNSKIKVSFQRKFNIQYLRVLGGFGGGESCLSESMELTRFSVLITFCQERKNASLKLGEK